MLSETPITHRRSVDCSSVGGLALLRALIQPGDVLFALDGPKLIRSYQRKTGYPERAASATHVAIAGDKGSVLHAVVAQGCIEGPLDYFLGREVAVGRWHADDKPQRTAALLRAARLMVGQRYEMGRLFRSLLKTETGRAPFVCSTFVDAAFEMAFDDATPLHRDSLRLLAPFMCPAHLYIQPGLRDP